MGAKQNDLTGKLFNDLTVLSLVSHNEDKKYRKRYWKCLCKCGNETIVATGQLTTNKTKSCGCIKNITNANNSINSRHKIIKQDAGYYHIYRAYKLGAIKRKKEFEFDVEDFISLLKGNCYYCGTEPKNIYSKNYYDVTYNGVDRVDNNGGYTKDNSVSCCKMCNISKNNNSKEDFIEWINRVYEHINKLKKDLNA